MKFSALALGVFSALCIAAPAPQGVPPPPASEVYIDQIVTGGTGCKPGSAAVVNAEDWKTVALIFDRYEATIGLDSPLPKRHVNCNINLKIHYPQGYQYTLYKIEYAGYAKLDQDVVSTQVSSYWFAGFPNVKANFKSTWTGKYDAPYSFTDTLATEAWVWSPCSASPTLNINTYLDLSNDKNKNGSGILSTEAEVSPVIIHNFKPAHIYGINWRKC